MADDEDEEEDGPVVELGEGKAVEGAPLARVASRLTWGSRDRNSNAGSVTSRSEPPTGRER